MALDGATEEDRTLQQLGQKLGLSETDIDVIRFRLATERHSVLRPLLIMAGRETSKSVIDILRQYLVESQRQRRRGVNILVHGEPGTGKTEIVRMLAAELGAELYEVAAARRNGSVLDSSERFPASHCCNACAPDAS